MFETIKTVRVEVPRVMIAAPHGRSGKTVLTLGLLRALRRRGLTVQPFKKGPDYIDTGWHTVAAERISRNLDCCFMDASQMRSTVFECAAPADVCVIEAAMGLYDGLDVEGSSSSAQVAKNTATPVILVLDVTRMTRTAAALVMGCCAFDPDVMIAGVILNKVRGERQRQVVTECIERYCGVPVVGSVPKDARLDVPDRHLGLVTSAETGFQDELLDGIAQVIEQYVDVGAVLEIARAAEKMVADQAGRYPETTVERACIAVVRDQAFSFYYPENLEALERAGARLVFVNSLVDESLPLDVDGLYIGGGFPEMFAPQLQGNESFRVSVRAHAESGLPVFAECGGLMYLGRSLVCDDTAFEMAGVLPLDTVMHEKQQAHGYAFATVGDTCSWLPTGAKLKGHEHHHSQVINLAARLPFAYQLDRGKGIAEGCDGVCYSNVIAGYLHVNALASPEWAPSFVEAAERVARS